MSTATAVTMLDVRAGSGAITLPLTTQIPYRVITIKDAYGAAALSSITINTQGNDVFENGASSITLTNAYDTTTLYAGQSGYWYTIGGSRLDATSFNTLSTGVITNPLRLGTLSTQTAIQFPGLRQGYTGTVIAEQGTGAGTQELLLYKASTTTDQIRLQTTGSIVFEAGASARSFPSTQMLATPTMYIQGTTSNVGIGTATPAATLDVVGQGRFQIVSSLALQTSSINGAAPWQPSFLTSTVQGLNSNISSMIDPTELTSSIVGLGTVGFISAVGLTYVVASTAQGLGTFGYTSTNQLLSTTIGVYGAIGSNIATTVQPQFVSTVQGLGSVGYISTSQLTSTVTGMMFSGSTTTLSSAVINVSSLSSSYIKATQGYISSLVVDSLAIGSNSGFINMGDIITTSISSLQINTGLFTASGAVCTSQLVVSSINGAAPWQPSFLTSTVQGLGSAGYVSTASLQSTFNAITYAISQNTVDTVFYLNPGIPAAPYRQISPTQTLLPQSTLTTSILRNTSNNAIAEFQTDFTVPQVIPDGAWDLNLFAYTDHARTYIYTSLFARAGVTETLIASSSNATTNIGTSPVQQYTNTLFVPQTVFTSTTNVSLVIKIFANNPMNQDDTLYTFYQGANYSHAHTTFGTVVPDTLFTSTVSGLGSAGYVSSLTNVALFSSLQMNVSSIVARTVSSATGYISSLRTDSLTVGGTDGYVTIQDLTTGTASTGQLVAGAGFISSLQINSLSFGPTGYVIVGNFIASSLSTMRLNTQEMYTNNAFIGNVSSQSAILFPGVDGNYRGTAVAEQTTGAGTGELLLYKVSTTTDQIRLQTTGNIVFEAGASLRSWPSTQTLATPTLFIQGTTSNVGVGTATPATTLDVAGTGRFQTISSLALNVSSINGAAPGGGAAFTGSTISLSTAIITTSSLGANVANFSTLTMRNTLNMFNNPLTNIYSALFAPTYSGINPNASAGGIYSIYTSGPLTYALHVFTTVGSSSFVPPTSITGAQVLIIAGGGSGGTNCAGGGGAGGLVYLTNYSIASASYSLTVGGGGVGNAVQGSNSTGFGFTALGGGAGGTNNGGAGQSGGCGGGGSAPSAAGGSATQTSNVSSPYPGFAGGTGGTGYGGAGGGGMGSVGSNGSGNTAGNGGNGLTLSITGSAITYCGGGGGGTAPTGSIAGTGGTGGGGNGGTMVGGNPTNGSNATNYGSGGGGGSGGASSGSGGSGFQGVVIIAYAINQFGANPFTVGTITGDATSNLSIQPVNTLSLVGTTQATGLLAASSFSTTYITAASISTAALQISSINGAAVPTAFTGSTLSLSTASIFTSSLRASTISVGGGAWMSNDGLYLSNAQAGGAVGKLVTHSGYVKLMTATAWNGGYGALAITGGDLTPKVYMGMGTSIAGGNLAIGGLSPSPGAGITLDVFGAARFSSISTFQAVASSMGVGTNQPQSLLDVAGTGRFQIVSTLALQISSINGSVAWQQSFLTSTIDGLGTSGYISTTQLGSTVTNLITRIGAGGGGAAFVGSTIFLSVAQVLFSTQTGYNISSVQGYVSSLQVDELQIGTGFGIIALGDTNMSSISTLGIAAGLGNFQTINVSSINGLIPGTGSGTSFTGNLGTVSSLTAIRFFGLTGGFTNTALAEVSTGTGTQELLLYKVSSISDQVRVQTTGNVIFEAGVGARGWPVAPRITAPTFYIAGSNSNVGVGTSNPLTTFDVAGTGRFQTLSSLNITAGSINYSIAFV